MNNIYLVFEKLIRAINLCGSSPCSILNIPVGEYFINDPLLFRFNEIIQKNLLVNDFNEPKNQNINEDVEAYTMELKDNLQLQTRLEVFILIYNRLFNVYTNEVLPGFKPVIKKIAQYLSIDKYTFEAIRTFYKNQFLRDTHDSMYIVGPNFNPLLSANGAKVNYSGSNNQITYIKLISNFDILFVKTTHVYKRYSELTEEIEISSIDLVDELKFSKQIKCDISYTELIKKISDPTTTNFIEIKQREAFPYIKLDPFKGSILIEGVSTPISPLSYLEPILDWIDLYCSTNKDLEINLNFNYYNTYTTKFLMRLIEKCNVLNNAGSKVIIYWNYSQNDDELKESGEFYQELFCNKLEFQLVSKN